MNSASPSLTWQSWSDKWGDWNLWLRSSRLADKAQISDEDSLMQRVLNPRAARPAVVSKQVVGRELMLDTTPTPTP